MVLTMKIYFVLSSFALRNFPLCWSSHQISYLLPSYTNWVGIECDFYLPSLPNGKQYTVDDGRWFHFFPFSKTLSTVQ